MKRLPATVLPILLAAAGLPCAAQPVTQLYHTLPGRLFTTPAERIQLDTLRQQGRTGIAPAEPPAPAAPPAAPPPPPAPVELSGVLRRSNGQATIWVDGAPRDQALPAGAPGGPVAVDIDGRRITIKPGQRYDATNGTVQDIR